MGSTGYDLKDAQRVVVVVVVVVVRGHPPLQ